MVFLNNNKSRLVINIKGIVQGVGFRPFVHKLATSLGIVGWVQNYSGEVCIEIEGLTEELALFTQKLKSETPALAYIDECSIIEKEVVGYTDFSIRESMDANSQDIYISPDASVCEDCIEEMFDIEDRRYKYPFINCTNCGPRYTIVKNVPYDRKYTTMDSFQMCESCFAEYHQKDNRRFHAQPIACSKCGPRLSLLDNKGNRIETGNEVEKTVELLTQGCIIAIKGLGGYHLACDATNYKAVQKLRKRKERDGKPFALMAKNINVVHHYCNANSYEIELLQKPSRPIVLMSMKEDVNLPIDSISVDSPRLGVMLPYTPLHHLLFDKEISVLVMTSGNKSGEPIYYRDQEALTGLMDIADYFLTHNREIFVRADDSVTSEFRGKEYLIRRSRGYAPFPVDLLNCLSSDVNKKNIKKLPSVLACGGELKSTFCITKETKAFLSHHIGDLENLETLKSFEEGVLHFERIFRASTEIVVFDKHPEYLSTKYAKDLKAGVKLEVQHHHAHIASCMAENGINRAVIGIAFDGTGYGCDGHIWGGEFFIGNYSGFERLGHFDYVPMPGGDASVREPWRMAWSYILKYSEYKSDLDRFNFLREIDPNRIDLLTQQIEKNINTPLTSSIGRLFDGISALLGLCNTIEYEGQAAIRLENAAKTELIEQESSYPYEISCIEGIYIINPQKVIENVLKDYLEGKSIKVISALFHNTIAFIVLDLCKLLRESYCLNEVALSGGVFQNRLLLELIVRKLEANRFVVYTHSKVPTNDGGICLGQAAIALNKYINEI